MALTYKLIQNFSLTTSTSTITFSSIPSTYTDLVFHVNLQDGLNTYTENINMTWNNITTNSYSGNGIATSNNGAPAAFSFVNTTAMTIVNPSSFTNVAINNTLGTVKVYIPNYRSSDRKVCYVTSVGAAGAINAGTTSWFFGGLNDAAVGALTTVSFTSPGGAYRAGGRVSLYGISNAI